MSLCRRVQLDSSPAGADSGRVLHRITGLFTTKVGADVSSCTHCSVAVWTGSANSQSQWTSRASSTSRAITRDNEPAGQLRLPIPKGHPAPTFLPSAEDDDGDVSGRSTLTSQAHIALVALRLSARLLAKAAESTRYQNSLSRTHCRLHVHQVAAAVSVVTGNEVWLLVAEGAVAIAVSVPIVAVSVSESFTLSLDVAAADSRHTEKDVPIGRCSPSDNLPRQPHYRRMHTQRFRHDRSHESGSPLLSWC
jgi:hypothetical protein